MSEVAHYMQSVSKLRTEIEVLKAQLQVVSEMYDKVHAERDELQQELDAVRAELTLARERTKGYRDKTEELDAALQWTQEQLVLARERGDALACPFPRSEDIAAWRELFPNSQFEMPELETLEKGVNIFGRTITEDVNTPEGGDPEGYH